MCNLLLFYYTQFSLRKKHEIREIEKVLTQKSLDRHYNTVEICDMSYDCRLLGMYTNILYFYSVELTEIISLLRNPKRRRCNFNTLFSKEAKFS